jgi:putative glutamine amidotransferase
MVKAKNERPRVLVLGTAGAPIRMAGGDPALLRVADDRALEAVEHDNVHGLLLTGGGDVDPIQYGEEPHKKVYGVSPARDTVELLAVEAAEQRGIPVMGICRGAQIMNVAFGGTLHQHIPDLEGTHAFHGGGHEHRVRTAKGSRLHAAWKGREEYVVSIHHQAVADVAPGFVATGWGLDGTIEAIESVEGWMLGVQFHPELATERAAQRRIFERFVTACAKAAGLPKPTVLRPAAPAKPKAKVVARYHKPAKARNDGVITRWRCFRCRDLDFDLREDYLDHMFYLHHVTFEHEAVKA